ncbi:hypothetical protein Tco_0840600 [Tanacetum coccineum]|uniref:Uncharacterized protein n=1 Tax=Tanacetum coccineum TaxID=301880 RepID=A0ABQ5AXZ1_9ASTR
MPEAYLHMAAMDKALCYFIEETSEGKRRNEVEAGPGDAVQGKPSQTCCLECLVFGGLLHVHSPFELATTVWPFKIKYNKIHVDTFWNSRKKSFTIRLLQLMLNAAVASQVYLQHGLNQADCDHVKRRQRSLIQWVLKRKTTGSDIETVDFDTDGIVRNSAGIDNEAASSITRVAKDDETQRQLACYTGNTVGGSILSNMLLVLRCAFFTGGIVHYPKIQRFNQTAAIVSSGLLLMAVMGILFPTILQFTHTEVHFGKSSVGYFQQYFMFQPGSL